MEKISAEKLARLEARILKLEKNASVIKDITGMFKFVWNIPANLIKKVFGAFRDIYTTIAPSVMKNVEKIHNHLGVNLAFRIARVLIGVTTSAESIPKIVKFNPEDPMRSIFTGGRAGSSKVTLIQLSKKYQGEQSKRIKAAYLSWYKDFKHILTPQSDTTYKEAFLKGLKRYSKLAYRFFSSILVVAGGYQVVTTGFLFQLVSLVGQWFFKTQGLEVVSSHIEVESITVTQPGFTGHVINPQHTEYMEMMKDLDSMPSSPSVSLHTNMDTAINFDPNTVSNIPPETIPYNVPDSKVNLTYEKVVNTKGQYLKGGWSDALRINAAITSLLLALIEKIMYRWVIKTEEFDEMAKGKTASRYPAISYLTHRFETAVYC